MKSDNLRRVHPKLEKQLLAFWNASKKGALTQSGRVMIGPNEVRVRIVGEAPATQSGSNNGRRKS